MAALGEGVASNRIDEKVVDDAVGFRVEARDDGVVVGKGEGGEDGYETGDGFGAIGDKALDVWRGALELIAIAEPIGGYEDHGGAVEGGEGAANKGWDQRGGGGAAEEESKG